MFKKQPAGSTVEIIFEGKPLKVAAGQTVAAALMGEGEMIFRASPVSNNPRGAFCMMGICYECLLEINDLPGQQGCMIPVRDGMKIKRQKSLGE